MTKDDLINQWIDISYWFMKCRESRTQLRKSVEDMLSAGKLPNLAKKIAELEKGQ